MSTTSAMQWQRQQQQTDAATSSFFVKAVTANPVHAVHEVAFSLSALALTLATAHVILACTCCSGINVALLGIVLTDQTVAPLFVSAPVLARLLRCSTQAGQSSAC